MIKQNPFSTIEERLDRIELAISSMKADPNKPNDIGGMDLASEITGRSHATIYKLVSMKEIPFYKNRGKLYFKRSELIDWITGRKGGTNHGK